MDTMTFKIARLIAITSLKWIKIYTYNIEPWPGFEVSIFWSGDRDDDHAAEMPRLSDSV
jgi:hypothetical protein